LLDGSRGIDFTSPRSLGPSGLLDGFASVAGHRLLPDPNIGADADASELKLVAYILRLLKRTELLRSELKTVCAEAEAELAQQGARLVSAGVVDAASFGKGVPATKVEVTAAQQRQLGQVPPPPVLPQLQQLLHYLRSSSPSQAQQLSAAGVRWKQEIRWLQEELKGTTKALDNALLAMRPLAQRFSIALGASAPEPQSRGLGLAQCAEMKEVATGHAAAIVSRVLSESTTLEGKAPSAPLRDLLSASVALLLQMQAWAEAPVSPAECRVALGAALQKIKAVSGSAGSEAGAEGNAAHKEVANTTHALQSFLCGAPLALSASTNAR